MTLDEAVAAVPPDCRFHVGHTPHFHKDAELPKLLRKRPFEAYVLRGLIGTKTWIFESADGATPAEALLAATAAAIKSIERGEQEREFEKSSRKR